MKAKKKSKPKDKRGIFFYVLTGLMFVIGGLVAIVSFIALLDKLHIINPPVPNPFLRKDSALEANKPGLVRSKIAQVSPLEDEKKSKPEAARQGKMFVTDIYASIYVKDASKTADELVVYANGLGGFLVKQNVNTYSEPYKYAKVSLTFRIPKVSADKFIAHLKEVVTEVKYLERYGTDIADQYEDISKKLEVYQETYQKIHDLMQKTDDVDTLLKLQDRLISVQRQIDYYKGRQQALEKQAQYVKVYVSLTDQKYAISMKKAYRFDISLEIKKALFALGRTLGSILRGVVWLGVYSVIWAPILYFVLRSKK